VKVVDVMKPNFSNRIVLSLILMLGVKNSIGLTQILEPEIDSIPVMIGGRIIHNPFAGGFDSSKPVLVDIDGDKDFDFLIGEEGGRIILYRNEGTAENFYFQLVTKDLLNFDAGIFAFPAVADIDNDGDVDLVVGEGKGNLNYFRNDGTPTDPSFKFITNNYFSIDVGEFSLPAFSDIDADGDFDLLVGEEDGNLNYYCNDGTPEQANFILITEEFFSINVESNYSIPSFVDIDGDNDLDLFLGEFGENINYYRNDGSVTEPDFVFVTHSFSSIDIGFENLASFADMDNDGDFDMLIGEDDGHINYFENTGSATEFSFVLVTENALGINDLGRYSNPTLVDIDNDGDLDLFVGEGSEFSSRGGRTYLFENIGTRFEPAFELVTDRFVDGNVGSFLAPAFVDVDADLDLDLFLGERDGTLNFYRNDGTPSEPVLSLVSESWLSIDVGKMSNPVFKDIDDDQDFDLLLGKLSGSISYYENVGTPSLAELVLESDQFLEINVGTQSAPTFADINADHKDDLFIGQRDQQVSFYMNTGTPNSREFLLFTDDFGSIDVGSNPVPAFADIDSDGDYDLFVGQREGGLAFYRNRTAPQGDLNDDRLVDVNDVILLISFILDPASHQPEYWQAIVADFNLDSGLDVKDLIALIQLILEIPN